MIITRRRLLQGGTYGAAAICAPAILRAHDALASSGSVNVFAWPDYIQANQIEAFEKKTGIAINLTSYGSNEEAEAKLKDTGGKGIDVMFPTITFGANYYAADILRPLDEAKIVNTGNIIESMLNDSLALGAQFQGKRMLLPFNWGTEAITFDSALLPLNDDDISFGVIWNEAFPAKVAVRQKSVIMGVGLYLEAIGKVESNRMLDVYKSEEDARRVWDVCLAFILERRSRIAAFWNTAPEAMAAFKDDGASMGQTWDTTGLLLNREDAKWKYRIPKEGGIAWMDGVGILSAAENVDQAYALINELLTPEMGGLMSQNTGYNSAVQGAADHAGEVYRRQFYEVYKLRELTNLWWWQPDTPWIAPLRQEYLDRITKG